MKSGASGVDAAKKVFKKAFLEASNESPDDPALAEAAFHAYAHQNPLIDRLFWSRLRTVERYILGRKTERVLDFGTGSGVMAYALAKHAPEIVATDIEPGPYRLMEQQVGFPASVRFASPDDIVSDKFDGAFDVIVALDVLEHMDNVPAALATFKRLLRPGGEAVISGPTENVLYRIGRTLAGRRFTGAYHVTDIRRIKAECREAGTVCDIRTLYPLLPLFDIFSVSFEK